MSHPSTRPSFVPCVRNRGYAASLVVRKVHRRLRNAGASRQGLARVIDESGEDDLYPAECFVGINLGAQARRALSQG